MTKRVTESCLKQCQTIPPKPVFPGKTGLGPGPPGAYSSSASSSASVTNASAASGVTNCGLKSIT